MPQDFSGQNLRGRSFKGQDLSEANFSHADIRGANFTNAILRGANFTEVVAGLQKRWAAAQLVVVVVLSATAGVILAYAGFLSIVILTPTEFR